MESTNAIPTAVAAPAHAGINVRKLFVLCCLCLATTSFSFILRGSNESEPPAVRRDGEIVGNERSRVWWK